MGWLSNTLRFSALLGLLFGLFLAIGYYFGGVSGMTWAFMIALVMNFFAYYYSDKIVLGMYGAREFDDPKIKSMVEKLARNAGIPTPKVYIVESMQPNAFATGRNPKNSAIAVTRGLLELLDDDEIEAVLSHEIAHIKNRDILISTIAATIAGAISYLAELAWWSSMFGDREDNRSFIALLPVIILAPIAAMMIQLAISRGREFLADETGARISKKPKALASALIKISRYAEKMPLQKGSTATSHMWIVNPFKSGLLTKLFSTHPPVEERVVRLEQMKVY